MRGVFATIVLVLVTAGCARQAAPSEDVSWADPSDWVSRAVASTQPVRPPDEAFVYTKFYVGSDHLEEQFAVRHWPSQTQLEWIAGGPSKLTFVAHVGDAEWKAFRQVVTDTGFASLPDNEFGAFDGVEYTVTSVTPKGTHRLLLNNVPRGDDEYDQPGNPTELAYDRLLDAFDALKARARFAPRADPSWAEQGIDVVWSSVLEEVDRIRRVDGNICVRLNRRGMTESRWCTLVERAGKYELVELPEEHWPAPLDRDMPGLLYYRDGASEEVVRYKQGVIRGGLREWNTPGTWWCRADRPAELITREMVVNPIVVDKERYLVGEFEGTLRLFDLTERKFFDLEPGIERYAPVAALDDQRVLIVRSDAGPRGDFIYRKYRVLDVRTRKSVEARPDEQVWSQDLPIVTQLEPTGEPGVVWVAHCTKARDHYTSTVVGRYDLNTLGFRKWQSVTNVRFETAQMMIDLNTQRILALHDGVLLSIPIDRDVWKDCADFQ